MRCGSRVWVTESSREYTVPPLVASVRSWSWLVPEAPVSSPPPPQPARLTATTMDAAAATSRFRLVPICFSFGGCVSPWYGGSFLWKAWWDRFCLAAGPRVQRIARRVPEEVERDDDGGDDRRGDEEEEEVGVDEVQRTAEHVAEGGRGVLDPDTEVAERGLGGDVGRHQQREVDQERRPQVGQDLLEVEPSARGPHEDGRVDELALADREHLAPDQAGDRRPAEDREHDDDVEAVDEGAVGAVGDAHVLHPVDQDPGEGQQ